MIFRLKDADVNQFEIGTETMSDGYCTTCYFEWTVYSLNIGIDGDSHKLDIEGTDINYSDIMILVLNGLNFFAQLTADDFLLFMKNYIQYRADLYDEPIMNFEDEGSYWMLFNNGKPIPSRW